ncbi:MAG: hypothetical protein GY804_10195 [Alphaproteobacteria bacterium]|nr:hypothetical protein [Alphaproteobacteria bacterium]
MKKVEEENRNKKSITRREFCVFAGFSAANICIVSNKPLLDAAQRAMHSEEIKGIEIYGKTKQEKEALKKTINFAYRMPELLKKVGIDYTDGVDKLNQLQNCVYIKAEERLAEDQGAMARFHDRDVPFWDDKISIDSDDVLTTNNDYTVNGSNTTLNDTILSVPVLTHEAVHKEQEVNNAITVEESGYSRNDIKYHGLEIENIAHTIENECLAMAILADLIDERIKNNFPVSSKDLPSLASYASDGLKKCTELRKISHCDPAIAVLDCIAKNGHEAVNDQRTKLASYEAVRSEEYTHIRMRHYSNFMNKRAKYHSLKHGHTPEGQGKPIEPIIEKMYSLIGMKFDKNDPNHPLSEKNKDIFARVFLDNNSQTTASNTSATKADQKIAALNPDVLNSPEQGQKQSVPQQTTGITKGFNFISRILNKKRERNS